MYLARQLTLLPVPPRCTGALPGDGAAGRAVGTLTAPVTVEAPASRRTWHRAVPLLPTWNKEH